MLCQNCKKRQATVYYKQTVNGVTRQVALCDHCAGQASPFEGFDLFGSLFAHGHGTPQSEKRCTLCGSTYAEIARSGRMGCAECYTVFAEELSPTLADMHGADARYLGRGAPLADTKDAAPLATEPPADPVLVSLRAALAQAVENEDYERAAALRDEIRAKEGGAD